MMRSAFAFLLAYASLASAQTSPDALDWLRRVYAATQRTSYSGAFVYQQGERTETSRITRIVDAKGDVEKLEVLDGVRREVVRTGDTVKCYLPDQRLLKIERRGDRRMFPALLPARIHQLEENYVVTLGGTRRVAGLDCQEIVLTPRDGLRYGYRLWADRASGMLLKAQIVDEKSEPIEQFTFAEFSAGNVSRERVRASHATAGWRIEDSAVSATDLAKAGWNLGPELPGFRKVAEVHRLVGQARPVDQVVYSDGLAAISVFIEPIAGRSESVGASLASMGAVHIYTREIANHLLTALGEVPAASVQRIADAVEFRGSR